MISRSVALRRALDVFLLRLSSRRYLWIAAIHLGPTPARYGLFAGIPILYTVSRIAAAPNCVRTRVGGARSESNIRPIADFHLEVHLLLLSEAPGIRRNLLP